jgi:hypothetical protein
MSFLTFNFVYKWHNAMCQTLIFVGALLSQLRCYWDRHDKIFWEVTNIFDWWRYSRSDALEPVFTVTYWSNINLMFLLYRKPNMLPPKKGHLFWLCVVKTNFALSNIWIFESIIIFYICKHSKNQILFNVIQGNYHAFQRSLTIFPFHETIFTL